MTEEQVLSDLGKIYADPPITRKICERCRRPGNACWCCHLPNPPLRVSTVIHILQHPFEENRRLKTAPMLYHGLERGRCHIYRGKRFPLDRLPILSTVLSQPATLLLYPGTDAVDIRHVRKLASDGVCSEARSCQMQHKDEGIEYHVVLLDGTWLQAKGIYNQNKWLHHLRQVKISSDRISEYVIRTQPTDGSLSTVESAAIALAVIEQRPEIEQMLVAPLRALCHHQIQHGAVRHDSKEHMILTGRYVKATSRSDRKKFNSAQSVVGEGGSDGVT